MNVIIDCKRGSFYFLPRGGLVKGLLCYSATLFICMASLGFVVAFGAGRGEGHSFEGFSWW